MEQPLPTAKGSKCLNHPDEEAVTRCKSCRKPLCVQCSLRKPDGTYCSDACWNKVKQHQARWAQDKAKAAEFEKNEAAARWRARLVWFAIFLALVGGAAYYLHTHPAALEKLTQALAPLLKKIGR